jgi:hypothetical protein
MGCFVLLFVDRRAAADDGDEDNNFEISSGYY